jgi:hypothetical protein
VANDEARRRYQRDFALVRKILGEDWDPIGCGVPEDEYDSYAPEIIRLLYDGVDARRLSDYLGRVAREAMSCKVPEARLELASGKLVALGLENKTPPA